MSQGAIGATFAIALGIGVGDLVAARDPDRNALTRLMRDYYALPSRQAKTRHPDAIRFGEILLDLRRQRGWTLQQFARESHMTATYLGLLERGLNLPRLTAIINLAEVLGVDPGELVRHAPPPASALRLRFSHRCPRMHLRPASNHQRILTLGAARYAALPS